MLLAFAACAGASPPPADVASAPAPVDPVVEPVAGRASDRVDRVFDPALESLESLVYYPGPDPAARLLEVLGGCQTEAERRVFLERDFGRRELRFVGFDQVSIAESIDRILAAFRDDQQRPGDPAVRARMADSADLYLTVRRESRIRRYAGTAPCLPVIR
ncbi:MAG TPA: hypothetical protein VF384_06825 [Planctomycetota bacterium]